MCAPAYFSLGLLLHYERQDVDGAEEAYRAAIEADPGQADAHSNLGLLLNERARLVEESDGETAAALYDECAQLWKFANDGWDDERTKRAEANAQRVRAALARSKKGDAGRGNKGGKQKKGKKAKGRK